MPGPRDWTPGDGSWLPDGRPLRTSRSLLLGTPRRRPLAPPRRARNVRPALLSAGVGIAAVAIALAPAFDPTSVQTHTFVWTTVGGTAIFIGVRVLRRNRGLDAVLPRALATIGIGAGALALLLTLALGWAWRSGGGSPSFALPAVPAAPAPLAASADEAPTGAQMKPSLEQLLTALGSDRGTDGTWPAALSVTEGRQVTDATDGRVLGALPDGVAMQYSPSSDRSAFALRLLNTSHPEEQARYDSSTHEVTWTD